MFGAGLLPPSKRPTEGLPECGRPTVGSVARSETGHNKVGNGWVLPQSPGYPSVVSPNCRICWSPGFSR